MVIHVALVAAIHAAAALVHVLPIVAVVAHRHAETVVQQLAVVIVLLLVVMDAHLVALRLVVDAAELVQASALDVLDAEDHVLVDVEAIVLEDVLGVVTVVPISALVIVELLVKQDVVPTAQVTAETIVGVLVQDVLVNVEQNVLVNVMDAPDVVLIVHINAATLVQQDALVVVVVEIAAKEDALHNVIPDVDLDVLAVPAVLEIVILIVLAVARMVV